jgi:phosphatidylglycerol:prolipoprotein diacylglycerol transferase
MLTYPSIDPVALELGPLEIHWYGITYLVGFAAAWWLAVMRSRQSWSPVQHKQVDDLVFYGALGVIVGGRCGYVLFYNFDRFLEQPLWLFYVWEGGMSFHGGLLGVLLSMTLFARRISQPVSAVFDFIAPLVPIGLGMGRLGNFIGQELWGRETDVPWAMVFPDDPQGLARHPSQLYQFALEGVALFCLLYWFSAKKRPPLAVGGLFLLGYGVFRFMIEFFRQPDSHIGFDAFDWMTRGQLLSVPMIIVGLLLLLRACKIQATSLQTDKN